jgi:hypothetical protein
VNQPVTPLPASTELAAISATLRAAFIDPVRRTACGRGRRARVPPFRHAVRLDAKRAPETDVRESLGQWAMSTVREWPPLPHPGGQETRVGCGLTVVLLRPSYGAVSTTHRLGNCQVWNESGGPGRRGGTACQGRLDAEFAVTPSCCFYGAAPGGEGSRLGTVQRTWSDSGSRVAPTRDR